MSDSVKIPKLRFKEFTEEWEEQRVDYLLEQYSNPVDVVATQNYRQIGTRSHGKGIFHKESVTGKELGNKRVFWVHEKALVINIVFAWEHSIALTSEREKGFIASHRFPMYLPKENRCNLNFIVEFFLRKYGKYLLELASPGGAGRNKTLGKSNFNELKLIVPSIEEQEKIIKFLSIVDRKIEKLREQVSLLEDYKKGMMQKIFSQEIRFKDDDGSEFEDWKDEKLGDISECLDNLREPLNKEERQKIQGNIPYWGANNIMDYINNYIFDETLILLAEDGGNFNDFKDKPIANISYGKCWVNNHTHILRKINNVSSNEFLFYSLIHKNITGYVSGGTRAKLTKREMLKIKINLPQLEEQIKIANFLTKIDQRIEASKKQLKESKEYKKALLQQMFI